MVHYNKWLIGLLGAAMLTACSDDVVDTVDKNHVVSSESDGDGVFMAINIKMPTATGTRSFTNGDNSSNSGEEVGKDFENNVRTVYLVLARKTDDEATNNTFIAWGEIPTNKIIPSTTGADYTTTAKFSKTDISQYYESLKDEDSRDVNVFVFCNPTLNLRSVLQAQESARNNSWVNSAGIFNAAEATAEIIWSENDFLMTNASIATRTLPQTIDDWNYFTVETNPFDLSGKNSQVDIDNSTEMSRGAVRVERAAARFDFRDASPNFNGKDGNNIYQVMFDTSTASEEKPNGDSYLNIELTKMSFVNMAKSYYYLRRVSEATPIGTPVNLNNTILCGAELPWFTDATGTQAEKSGNYVIGVYASKMLTGITNDFSTYFNYPVFTEEGEIEHDIFESWYTTVINDLLKNPTDNNNSYHIWRYSTENSIPGVELQKNGQTTGVVFKGKMIAPAYAADSDDENLKELAKIINNADKSLTGDPSADPTLYLFAGQLYATWPNVEQAAKEAAITPVWVADNNNSDGGHWTLEINRGNTFFHAVFGDGGCGSYTFRDSKGTEYTVDDPLEISETAPNYLWYEWVEAGRPDIEHAVTLKFKKAATENNFTLYQTSIDTTTGPGYYCYYYYWNRHNDNGRNGIMGPMEFCVIRNNVYKLSVSKISQLGHPRHSTNDPNPPTPETDDEIDDIYLTVDVDVLPWVVRVNEIEF